MASFNEQRGVWRKAGHQPTAEQVNAALAAAESAVCPQAVASIEVNAVNTISNAATAVALAATIASMASDASAAAVQAAALLAAAEYPDWTPAGKAAQYVAEHALPGDGKGMGQSAALAAYAAIPGQSSRGWGRSTETSPSSVILSRFWMGAAAAADKGKKAGLDASVHDIVAAITHEVDQQKTKERKKGANAVLSAVQSARDMGESSMAVLSAAFSACGSALSASWPLKLKFNAANPGSWGQSLTVTTDVDGITRQVAGLIGIDQKDLFNLTAQYEPRAVKW